MERIEIYSSKKKSLLLFIGSFIFVVAGLFLLLNADNVASGRYSNPIYIKIIATISVLFFGFGMYVAVKRLIKARLTLVIDETGIDVNPEKPMSAKIEWENLDGFSEIKIQGTKLILIHVNNSDYWIENEKNKLRKKMMSFNIRSYGTPFSLSANSMQINHTELMNLLDESLKQNKNKTL
ncbi:hypothetical protein D0T53_04555 [Dysgonomonas sp. 216]|uniref:STM3941 family protein n=1 Tax=Dysgonomonas sp. 216 TaxID=2302934 RepID=UPI0013D2189A|nr:STM3941 family protein [Dysgonomonas sp. 216]NDW18189.1 hypothetical protein [Dysgonomonas sp. 216]